MQELAWRKKSNDIIAFGHDGSFGHDGHHPIQRAPSNVAAYSSVSIAVPEPPVLGQDGSTAATPKLITHAEMLSTSQHSRGTHSEWPDGRKSCTLQDMLFNTAPSTFRPSFSAHSSHQQIGSDRASAHSAQIAVSEDGNAEWHSDKASDIPSDASRLIDEGMHKSLDRLDASLAVVNNVPCQCLARIPIWMLHKFRKRCSSAKNKF